MKESKRQKAYDIYREQWSDISNEDLAQLLGVAASDIAKWKKEDQWKSKYEQDQYIYGAQPCFWVSVAVSLRYSAEILLKELKGSHGQKIRMEFKDAFGAISEDQSITDLLSKAYWMLVGLSLENWMKGIWIYLEPKKLVNPKEGKLSEDIVNTHDLPKLATKIGLDLTYKNEKLGNFLKRITEFVLWEGRYPVAKKASTMKGPSLDPVKHSDKVEFLFKSLQKKLQDIAKGNSLGVFSFGPRINWP